MSVRPPLLAERVLRWLLPEMDREAALGDLHEEFVAKVSSRGTALARWWYRRQVLASIGPALHRRFEGASLMLEVRHAVRGVVRRPVVFGVAILTLALGIGGTAGLYSVVEAVLLRPLPYPDSHELVTIWNTYDSWRGHEVLDAFWDHIELSYPEYLDLRDSQTSYDDVGIYSTLFATLTDLGDPTKVPVGQASASLFPMLGVAPVVGRLFAKGEEGAGAPQVALLSHELWVERWGGDTAVLGTPVTLDGVSFVVVGVLPEGFAVRSLSTPSGALTRHAVWTPIGTFGRDLDRGNHNYEALARLAEGISIDVARAQTVSILRGRATPEQRGARVEWRKAQEVGAARRPLLLLLGAVALLFAIACGNVAALMLAEAGRRRPELATRVVLGAGRGRIVRQLLVEGILAGVVAAAAGIGFAVVAVEVLLRLAPADVPLPVDAGLSPTVIVASLILGVASGVLIGLITASAVEGGDMQGALRGEGGVETRRGRFVGSVILAGQLSLSLVLLVGSGLLTRSLLSLLSEDPGFDPGTVVTARVELSAARYPTSDDAGAFFEALVRRIGSEPGVTAVAGSSALPFSWRGGSSSFQIVGREVPDSEKSPEALRRTVVPGYHELLGIPLLAGRMLAADDREVGAPVVVVSRSMAERYFPDDDAVGSRIARDRREFEIVGVVGDVRHVSLGEEAQPAFYVPLAVAENRGAMTLLVRSALPDAQVARRIREAVWALDAQVPVDEVSTMDALVAASTRAERFRTLILIAFAAGATFLSALGVFGAAARGVDARTRELGVRIALGADRARLLRDVVGRHAAPLTAGLVLGVAGAAVGSRALTGLLYEIDPVDPVVFSGASVLLFAIGLSATLLAGRRALSTDPVDSIRAD